MTPFQRISLSQDENEAMLEESQLWTSGKLSNVDLLAAVAEERPEDEEEHEDDDDEPALLTRKEKFVMVDSLRRLFMNFLT